MAAKKKDVDTLSLGLSLPSPTSVVGSTGPVQVRHEAPADSCQAEAGPFPLDELDDYDDESTEPDPPKVVNVFVELVGKSIDGQTSDLFEVSRLRNNGASFARVMFRRDELEELITRAQDALRV